MVINPTGNPGSWSVIAIGHIQMLWNCVNVTNMNSTAP